MFTLTNSILLTVWAIFNNKVLFGPSQENVLLPFPTASASTYYSQEDPDSKDSLDFRHHNYKDMRMVRRGQMCWGAFLSMMTNVFLLS